MAETTVWGGLARNLSWTLEATHLMEAHQAAHSHGPEPTVLVTCKEFVQWEIGLVLQNQERSSKGIILQGLLITYSSGIRAQQS